jgi:hypothetical protein
MDSSRDLLFFGLGESVVLVMEEIRTGDESFGEKA